MSTMPSPANPSPDQPPPAKTDHLRSPTRRSSGHLNHHQRQNQPPPPTKSATINLHKAPASTSSPAMALPSPGHLRQAVPPADSPPNHLALPSHKTTSSPDNSQANPVEDYYEEEEEDYGHGFIAMGGSFGKTMPFEMIQARKHLEACQHELFKAKLEWKKKVEAVNVKTGLLVEEEEALMEVEEGETPEAEVDPNGRELKLNADENVHFRQQMNAALAFIHKEQGEILEVDAILGKEEKKLLLQPRAPAEGRPENRPELKVVPAVAAPKALAGAQVSSHRAGQPSPSGMGCLVTPLTPITSNHSLTEKTSINRCDLVPAKISNSNLNLNSNSPSTLVLENEESRDSPSPTRSEPNLTATVSQRLTGQRLTGQTLTKSPSSFLPIAEHPHPPLPPATNTKPFFLEFSSI